MKKNLLLLFLLLFTSTILSAQKKKNKGENFHWVSEQYVIGASGGQFHPDMTAFNNQLTAWGAKTVFYQGLRGYGISIVEPVPQTFRGIGTFDGAAAFDLLLPANVTIGPNDSLTFQMKGWRLMTSALGKDFIPGKTVALVLAPGFDWGKLKMKRTLGGSGSLYKNIYVSPLARAELRFVFGPVALGARGIYRYDISKDTWKLKSGPAYELPGTKNTGFSIEFFAGWGYVHFQ